ncbi:cobalamin biosynthesis protein CobD [Ornithinibacillus gellani]|uniref:adenosylcobinamide-phosphate synthase CbiB n=1 Tax=Ornithinibacillus gellani TaxID=2293253 RepID=UPI000F48D7AB|nr:adenosylcobinamide-phosphate synthase CbiB [Ornithinibacillus gellani]TQS74766.1 cobalamin biosynthesis protein CobD [Ornithinibacillus gellani]
MIHHVIAIAFAYVLDRIIGDPLNWPHPVRWMGSLISRLDKWLNRGKYKRLNGVFMVLILLIIVGLIVGLLVWGCYQIHPIVGIAVEGIIIATTIAQKSLKDAALVVDAALEKHDMIDAREKLQYIVGRDTAALDESEIVRATVETVAENTTDGITAPLFWAWIGGAPLAMMYRAINTCDSMVGYRNEKYEAFGWASARLDDVVNWIPARLTGFVSMFAGRPKYGNRKTAWAVLRRDAKKHNSPNSGWGEAAAAAMLGIQLGGINYYQGKQSIAPTMGDQHQVLTRLHIGQVIIWMKKTIYLFILLLMIGGLLYEAATTWCQSGLCL